MLILNRKSGQDVLVPQYGIILKIVEVRGNQVRVGITAPPGIKVYRGENWKPVHSHRASKKAGASTDDKQEKFLMDEKDPVAAELTELTHTGSSMPNDSSGPVSDEEITAAERELGLIFPKSYRTFIRQYGAGRIEFYEIFGIPRDRLWGDVVMMNQLASRQVPRQYLQFTSDGDGFAYYLDTSQARSDGECPVVVCGPGNEAEIIADSFLDFLRKVREGVI